MTTPSSRPARTATTEGFSRPDLIPRRLVANATTTRLHPAVLSEAERRAASVQLRVADAITAFAGSMKFVYLHIVVFAAWMLFFEPSPWPTLTLIVSLEAIFLSTFVMIGQNRQASFQQAKADRDYNSSEKLLEENTDLTRLVHELSKQIHAAVLAEIANPTLETKPIATTDYRSPSDRTS
ncbi:DUF1003 domain-containing protein [Subtercola sp. PAMC28395]|uniref:DUF1003 domain-containing protein n=1 Tax=Subtercola sp. PAMC28395 TaxID=2846775 RepID=UPI001C0DEA49|nr:DUF1003 domain-containing protein [Subtercola sp. PAMC28395]QWT23578.1 DUF1003 domain-containing protein [Subtercola sp. PAMC28395]